MELLWVILIGAVIGVLGSLISGRSANWIVTILVGIAGNAIGFYVWRALGGDNVIMGYVLGVVAAALLLVLLSGMRARRV